MVVVVEEEQLKEEEHRRELFGLIELMRKMRMVVKLRFAMEGTEKK